MRLKTPFLAGKAFGTVACVLTAAASQFASEGAWASWTLGNGDTLAFAELFADGSDRTVYINDKKFVFESYTSAHFPVRDITLVGFVSASANQYGLYNVGFDLTGGFADVPGDSQVAEGNLQYTVEVMPEVYARGVRLCDVRATFNGGVSGEGSFARVDESIFDLDTNTFLDQLSVFNLAGPPAESRFTDYRDFCDQYPEGFRAFEVNKDFKFFSPTAEGTASASFIRQEFSQIPAPGALALFGLAGCLARRRRA